MFKSREIRWFTNHEDPSISRWFAGHDLNFRDSEARTDHYLPQPDKMDTGIKLREGLVEVKQRQGKPQQTSICPNARGYFEEYIKWSFKLAEEDPLSEAIIGEKKYGWTEVKKTRLGLKLTLQGEKSELVSISEQIPFGCQIEYTRVQAMGKTWFSFGLEWFGEKSIDVSPDLILEILKDSKLHLNDSMGYAEFLTRITAT